MAGSHKSNDWYAENQSAEQVMRARLREGLIRQVQEALVEMSAAELQELLRMPLVAKHTLAWRGRR